MSSVGGADSTLAATAHDLEHLRAVLLKCDAQTQTFLGPLLPLRAVQQVLLSFVRDTTRTFEDWVWDPSVRQLLNQLREQNPQAHHHAQDVDRWFERAAHDQWTYQQALHAADSSEQLLRDADAAQDAGKCKFKVRDFYAAKNAFEKSLEHLAAYVASEHYGNAVDVNDWEPALQQRYVTLCTNVAICGIKLHDLSAIRAYAHRALAVDPRACKALYATAKLHLLEHMYEDAYAVVDRALQLEPANALLVKFRTEIDDARTRDDRERAHLALVAQQALAEHAREQLELVERQRARDTVRVTASDFVPLPALDDDAQASSRIHTYFSRVKRELRVEITQLHDPDNSEPPLFACSMTDATTGAVLASDVRAASKKTVKNDAAKVAIRALWAAKTAAGTLIEEDVAYLAQREQTPHSGSSSGSGSAEPEREGDPAATSSSPSLPELPVQLYTNERTLDTVMLLNQLQQQKRLLVEYEVEDLQPESKTSTEFRCTVRINGAPLGVATAPAKKKARVEAAQRAFAAALAANIVKYKDPESCDDDGESNSAEQ